MRKKTARNKRVFVHSIKYEPDEKTMERLSKSVCR